MESLLSGNIKVENMSKSDNKIKLSEEEVVKIIIDLDQIVVSLDKNQESFYR